MSSSALYTFSGPTKDRLRSFRLSTSRAKDPQAIIYEIDKKTLEIRSSTPEVYTSLEELAEDLPDHSPRFILLSYPVTLDSGRQTAPYVLLAYLPATCNAEARMLYAGAKELVRAQAEVNRVLDVDSFEDCDEVASRVKALA